LEFDDTEDDNLPPGLISYIHSSHEDTTNSGHDQPDPYTEEQGPPGSYEYTLSNEPDVMEDLENLPTGKDFDNELAKLDGKVEDGAETEKGDE